MISNKLVKKLFNYGGSTIYEDNRIYNFKDLIDSCITSEEIALFMKSHNNHLWYIEACAAIIMEKFFDTKYEDINESITNEILNMSTSEIYNKMLKKSKQIKLNQKIANIDKDF